MASAWFDAAPRLMSRSLTLTAAALSVAGCVTSQTHVASAVTSAPPRAAASERTAAAPARAKLLHHTSAPQTSARSFAGIASYYWEGSRVASGGRFEPNGLTAAHRSLPFGTRLKVSDPRSGKSVIVTVNDRGPFVPGRVLDLSLGAARALGIEGRGLNRVQADVL